MLNGSKYNIYNINKHNVLERIEIIKKQYGNLNSISFMPQPYDQLALNYKYIGFREEEKQVLIEKRNDNLRDGQTTMLKRFYNSLLKYSIGYGYKFENWLFIGGLFIFFGNFLFYLAYINKIIIPKNSPSNTEKYGVFYFFFYSIDKFLPAFSLSLAEGWNINNNSDLSGLDTRIKFLNSSVMFSIVKKYEIIHKLVGWVTGIVLVSFLTASILI